MINNNLTNEERDKFARALKARRDDPWIFCIELLLRSGMRTEELTKLDTKAHVNQTNGTLFIVAAKGSNNRTVPLDRKMIGTIMAHFNGAMLDRFGLSPKSFKRQLARRFDRFKFETLGYNYGHVTLHGLRATFAMAIYQGVENDVLLVSKLLGHKSIQNTMVYVENLNFQSKYSKIKGAI